MISKYSTIPTDAEGYLVNLNNWDLDLAKHIAEKENIEMTDLHWACVTFIRDFFLQHHTMPKMRELIQTLRQQPEFSNINSATIQRLFPLGPALQAAKIAGLPKPVKCL